MVAPPSVRYTSAQADTRPAALLFNQLFGEIFSLSLVLASAASILGPREAEGLLAGIDDLDGAVTDVRQTLAPPGGGIIGTARRPAPSARHGSVHCAAGRDHEPVFVPARRHLGPGLPGQGGPQGGGEAVRPRPEPALVPFDRATLPDKQLTSSRTRFRVSRRDGKGGRRTWWLRSNRWCASSTMRKGSGGRNPPASSGRRTLEQSRWSARHRAWLVKAPSGRSLPLATLEPVRADLRTVPLGHGAKSAGWS